MLSADILGMISINFVLYGILSLCFPTFCCSEEIQQRLRYPWLNESCKHRPDFEPAKRRMGSKYPERQVLFL